VNDDFQVLNLPPEHPTIVRLRNAYLRRWNLPGDREVPGKRYWGVTVADRIVLVAGYLPRPDNSLEITDFFVIPSRDGVRACYYVLAYLKTSVDAQKVAYVLGATIARNGAMQRRIRTAFGRAGEPLTWVYKYPNPFVGG
jgi:hypothetical protein